MQLELVFHVGQVLPCASVDATVAGFFRAHLTPAFADFLWAITTAGSELWVTSLLLAMTACLVWKRSWHRLATLMLAVPGGALLSETLKLLVQRPRPFVAGPWGEWGGYSFPSGHTIAATLLYGFLALTLFSVLKRAHWRLLSVASAGLLVLSVAFSRVALGAHYLSDVLAAMLLGTSWLLLCSGVVRRLRPVVATTADNSPQP